MGAKMECIVFDSSFIGCVKKIKQPNALHFSAELFSSNDWLSYRTGPRLRRKLG